MNVKINTTKRGQY